MRFFIELAYDGTPFFGWQRQPNQISIQETIENALATILNTSIQIVGCGRTDTGVHALQYFAHFNFEGEFPKGFLRRLNKFLPPSIVIYHLQQVEEDAHARFDATSRSYKYHLGLEKNPFRQKTAYFYPFAKDLDLSVLNSAAQLLLNYDEFFPFCKTNTDAKTMKCQITRSEWQSVDLPYPELVFHISADRFLRGMVRLIVGMCLNVGHGKLTLEQVQTALEKQERLPKSLSVAPHGLFLTDIQYPYV